MAGFISRLKQLFYGTPTVAGAAGPVRIGPSGRVQQVPLDRFVAGRQGIGTKIAAEYGHPDADLSLTQIDRLFRGEWVNVTSTWIAALHWNPQTTSLTARLIKGGKEYGGKTFVSPSELAAGASSPSKGHWLNNIWKARR